MKRMESNERNQNRGNFHEAGLYWTGVEESFVLRMFSEAFADDQRP
jgi:hypothetical protein